MEASSIEIDENADKTTEDILEKILFHLIEAIEAEKNVKQNKVEEDFNHGCI